MSDERTRIDRWLWCTRFYKSRALASEAVAGGHVRVGGVRVKPARALKVGDLVTIRRGGVDLDCHVLALPTRRGPASEAAQSYEETPQSAQRRAEHAARMRQDASGAAQFDRRPDRRERRVLRQLRGRD